jgi:hypothetical protein
MVISYCAVVRMKRTLLQGYRGYAQGGRKINPVAVVSDIGRCSASFTKYLMKIGNDSISQIC